MRTKSIIITVAAALIANACGESALNKKEP